MFRRTCTPRILTAVLSLCLSSQGGPHRESAPSASAQGPPRGYRHLHSRRDPSSQMLMIFESCLLYKLGKQHKGRALATVVAPVYAPAHSPRTIALADWSLPE